MSTAEIFVVACGGPGFKEPYGFPVTVIDNSDNSASPCWRYQEALDLCNYDWIVMAHDDLEIHDPEWFPRMAFVMDSSENVVAVGLGGATALGNRDLYRKPYSIWNMARHGYASNQTDAEVHGARFTGVRRVAVLDAFFMAIRTDWLRSIGGWPTDHLTHHMLDAFIACEAARGGKDICQVGVSCTHHGGGTSTKPEYAKAKWLKGGSMESDHQEPHLWLANEYRDVLPIIV